MTWKGWLILAMIALAILVPLATAVDQGFPPSRPCPRCMAVSTSPGPQGFRASHDRYDSGTNCVCPRCGMRWYCPAYDGWEGRLLRIRELAR